MYNISATTHAAPRSGQADPTSRLNRSMAGGANAPVDVSNTHSLEALAGVSTPGTVTDVPRDALSVERRYKAAIGLWWALHLWDATRTPHGESRALAHSLVQCMDAGQLPSADVLKRWDRCFGTLCPDVPEAAGNLAMVRRVRAMLQGQGGDIRIADPTLQGRWIMVGTMVAVLWPRQFHGPVAPSPGLWNSLHGVVAHLLACDTAGKLDDCAGRLANFAADLRAEPSFKGVLPPDLLAYSHCLDAASALARGKDDAYYDDLGRRPADVG